MLRGNILNQTGGGDGHLEWTWIARSLYMGGTPTKFTETFGSNKFNLSDKITSPVGSDRSPRQPGKYTMTEVDEILWIDHFPTAHRRPT